MEGNIWCSVVVLKIQIERRIIMANIENKEKTNTPINKTTETLLKELETMSDTGLHDLFLFFYRLNCQHGNMIYNDKFNEFLEAFNSNPFRHHEDKAFRNELIENLTKYCFDHMSLLTATLLLKKKFTIEEVINNYYSNVDVFGYDMF